MSERERLIEILNNTLIQGRTLEDRFYKSVIEKIADHLLDNGVIVPPVKVGDIVWIIYDNYVTPGKILAFYIDGVGCMVDLLVYTKEDTVIGNKSIISKDYTINDIFLTKEAALKALKEVSK